LHTIDNSWICCLCYEIVSSRQIWNRCWLQVGWLLHFSCCMTGFLQSLREKITQSKLSLYVNSSTNTLESFHRNSCPANWEFEAIVTECSQLGLIVFPIHRSKYRQRWYVVILSLFQHYIHGLPRWGPEFDLSVICDVAAHSHHSANQNSTLYQKSQFRTAPCFYPKTTLLSLPSTWSYYSL
jgi:hypothetical protein